AGTGIDGRDCPLEEVVGRCLDSDGCLIRLSKSMAARQSRAGKGNGYQRSSVEHHSFPPLAARRLKRGSNYLLANGGLSVPSRSFNAARLSPCGRFRNRPMPMESGILPL